MPKEVKAFKCNYCPRVYLTKAAANRHEFFCFKNSELYGKCDAYDRYYGEQIDGLREVIAELRRQK